MGGITLTLKYKDGERTIIVPSDAAVVNLGLGKKADLKSGAKIFIPRWSTGTTVASQVPLTFFPSNWQNVFVSGLAMCLRAAGFSERRIQGARVE